MTPPEEPLAATHQQMPARGWRPAPKPPRLALGLFHRAHAHLDQALPHPISFSSRSRTLGPGLAASNCFSTAAPGLPATAEPAGVVGPAGDIATPSAIRRS